MLPACRSARAWAPWLTRQDAGKRDLHVTVQNKVDPARFFDNRFIDYANGFDREKVYQLAAKYKGQALK